MKKFLSVILVSAIMLSIAVVSDEVSACSGKKHTVKFYSDKTLHKSQTVKCGKAATAPKNPSKPGYIFIGWDKSFSKVTKNISINAVFKSNAKSYTVSFNTCGGSKVSSQTVKYMTTAKRPPDPTRKGYVFAGWYSDSVLKTSYDFSAKVTKNIKLYAKWEKDGNNGAAEWNGAQQTMTLNDVRAIAQKKGADLVMDDLRDFIGTDIGSGLHVMRYFIDDPDYILLVGSGDARTVEYAVLIHTPNGSGDEYIDIRYYDVDKFIANDVKVLV